MGSLTALLLATPIFGFSLSAPAVQPAFDITARTAAVLQMEADGGASAGADGDAGEEDDATDEEGASESSAEGSSDDEYTRELRKRNDLASIHRIFGISTWAAMTATIITGSMSYYNLYGFFDSQGENPCVTGDAIGGDGGCKSMRTVHAVSAGLTTALYATTFTLSIMMPDPDDLSEGKGEFASTLRLHKTLRWVHFGGMVAQALIGIVMANNLLGLDRANDYDTLQALGTVHLATGLVTYGALTWAGALMVF